MRTISTGYLGLFIGYHISDMPLSEPQTGAALIAAVVLVTLMGWVK